MAESKFNFIQALHEVVRRRKLLCAVTFGMAVLGVLVALSRPKAYTSTVVLAPELSNTNRMSESLGSLTAMIGIDLNSMSNYNVDAIFPEIYPKVLASPDFVVELWSCPVTLTDGTTKSYYEHVRDDGFVPFWQKPFQWIGSKEEDDDELAQTAYRDSLPDPRFFSRKLEALTNRMVNSILCDVSRDNGLITIAVTDEDPRVACAMADTVQRKLQAYITRYRTQKARNDYEYALRLVEEARTEYLDAQLAAARFADANISVFKQKVIIERDILQNEFQLKYNTYNALSSQLQNAKALIQAATPVYTIIRNASVPNYASSTSRTLTVLLYALVGFVFALVWILFGEQYLHELRNEYKNFNG